MTGQPASSDDPAASERQLQGFIDKFTPEAAALIRAARAELRARMPGAIELVYDNYNALAIGFASTRRTSDVTVSLACYASGVLLYFYYGASLPDPEGLLQGSGNQGRHIRLTDPSLIAEPAVEALLAAAIDHGRQPMPPDGGFSIVKAISAQQRPRRAPTKEPA
jgi:hypothetical protein